MIRVYFEEREPVDFPANHSQVGAAGELILQDLVVVEETDPRDIRIKRQTLQVQRWYVTFGPASRWLYCEPVEDEGAETDEAEPGEPEGTEQ